MRKEYLNNDDDDNLSKIYFQQFYDRISNIIELLVRHIRGQDVLHLHGKLGVGLDDTLSVHQLHLHRMFRCKVSDSLCYVSVRPGGVVGVEPGEHGDGQADQAEHHDKADERYACKHLVKLVQLKESKNLKEG